MKGRMSRAGPVAVRAFCLSLPALIALWVLLVLYPNPLKLAVSLRRLASPQVDAAATRTLAASLPSDPAAIEKGVLEALPYRYDWEAYSMPWYYPSVGEALEKGHGDCKARAIVLASVFEVKGIPYRINSSPTHVWVDYSGKENSTIENPGVQLYEVDPETGGRSLHFPRIDLAGSWRTFWRGFWTPMPAVRKALLLSGPALLLGARIAIAWRRKASRNRATAPGSSW